MSSNKFTDPRDAQAELPKTTDQYGKPSRGERTQRSEEGNEGHSGLPLKADGTERYPSNDQEGKVERHFNK